MKLYVCTASTEIQALVKRKSGGYKYYTLSPVQVCFDFQWEHPSVMIVATGNDVNATPNIPCAGSWCDRLRALNLMH
jgi:hypothetical protein